MFGHVCADFECIYFRPITSTTTQLFGRELLFLAGISPRPTPYMLCTLSVSHWHSSHLSIPRPIDPAKVTAQADDGMAPVEDQRREECAHPGRVGEWSIGEYIGQE